MPNDMLRPQVMPPDDWEPPDFHQAYAYNRADRPMSIKDTIAELVASGLIGSGLTDPVEGASPLAYEPEGVQQAHALDAANRFFEGGLLPQYFNVPGALVSVAQAGKDFVENPSPRSALRSLGVAGVGNDEVASTSFAGPRQVSLFDDENSLPSFAGEAHAGRRERDQKKLNESLRDLEKSKTDQQKILLDRLREEGIQKDKDAARAIEERDKKAAFEKEEAHRKATTRFRDRDPYFLSTALTGASWGLPAAAGIGLGLKKRFANKAAEKRISEGIDSFTDSLASGNIADAYLKRGVLRRENEMLDATAGYGGAIREYAPVAVLSAGTGVSSRAIPDATDALNFPQGPEKERAKEDAWETLTDPMALGLGALEGTLLYHKLKGKRPGSYAMSKEIGDMGGSNATRDEFADYALRGEHLNASGRFNKRAFGAADDIDVNDMLETPAPRRAARAAAPPPAAAGPAPAAPATPSPANPAPSSGRRYHDVRDDRGRFASAPKQ